jgi:hypothetical protein
MTRTSHPTLQPKLQGRPLKKFQLELKKIVKSRIFHNSTIMRPKSIWTNNAVKKSIFLDNRTGEMLSATRGTKKVFEKKSQIFQDYEKNEQPRARPDLEKNGSSHIIKNNMPPGMAGGNHPEGRQVVNGTPLGYPGHFPKPKNPQPDSTNTKGVLQGGV